MPIPDAARTIVETTPDLTQSLTDLDFERLKQVMFDRLHGEQSIGPATDPRGGPEPFEWLVEQFQRGDSGLRDRMTVVMREFLAELTDLQRWPTRARNDLLDLIQYCGSGLVDELHRLIRAETLWKLPYEGPPAHAGLLKCLISLGRRGTPDFWVEQSQLLGPPYGALIFRGLMEHGLEFAVRHLPELSADAEALVNLRLLLPIVEDRFGSETVAEAFRKQFPRLSAEAREAFAVDLSGTADASKGTAREPVFGTLASITDASSDWNETNLLASPRIPPIHQPPHILAKAS
jgi:hypothetical protein